MIENRKKKIIIISSLFPAYQGQSRKEVTYALIDIYKEIKDEFEINIFSIWRYYPKIFDFTKKARNANRLSYTDKITIEELNIFRIPIKAFPKRIESKISIVQAANIIDKILCKIDFIPEKVICHTIIPSLLIGKNIAKKYSIPIIICFHNSDYNKIRNKKYLNLYLSNCNGFVFRSFKIKEYFVHCMNKSKLLFDDKKMFLLLSGFKYDEIKENRDKLCNKAKKKNLEFITVSNLNSKNKNIDVIIKAFLKFNKHDTRLKIIGDGKYLEKYKKIAKPRENHILFLGELSRKEVFNHLENADVFILVSKKETFGLVYLEAMLKGCIVVGSKNEGIDGYIKDNMNGYLVESNNIEKLIQVMQEIYFMTEERKKAIIENSYNQLVEYSNDVIIKKYKKYINEDS